MDYLSKEFIANKIKDSIKVKEAILKESHLLNCILNVSKIVVSAYRNKKKVLFMGNGGSAADAQHLAAELSGRFYFDRPPLFAEALHVNTSYLTAVANDYSYDEVFARLVQSKARKGDILIGLSTSGNSGNIIKAFEMGNSIGTVSIGITGATGGKMKDLVSVLINVPSMDTPRIQEVHILIGHIICEIVERSLFSND